MIGAGAAIAIPTPGVPPKKGRSRGKRSNAGYTQVGAYIPKALKKQIDRLLIDEDETDFSDLVTQLLQDWISSKSDK
jgi:predicted ABC-class ATPase